jgi:hypothetical protein
MKCLLALSYSNQEPKPSLSVVLSLLDPACPWTGTVVEAEALDVSQAMSCSGNGPSRRKLPLDLMAALERKTS